MEISWLQFGILMQLIMLQLIIISVDSSWALCKIFILFYFLFIFKLGRYIEPTCPPFPLHFQDFYPCQTWSYNLSKLNHSLSPLTTLEWTRPWVVQGGGRGGCATFHSTTLRLVGKCARWWYTWDSHPKYFIRHVVGFWCYNSC